jgi:release factor glutamine methyltransferase
MDPSSQRVRQRLNRSQRRQFPYSVDVLGHEFVVERGVFSPDYYAETEFFARRIREYIQPEMSYLDLGCGIGVTAIMAAMRGAHVVALDINPIAVRNTRLNAAGFGLESMIDVRVSDVFASVGTHERFDIVFWNPPFCGESPAARASVLQQAVFDPGYRKSIEFLESVGRYVNRGAHILIGTSITLGHFSCVEAAADRIGLDVEVVDRAWDPAPGSRTSLELLRVRHTGRSITD